jgi:hypothetical protein
MTDSHTLTNHRDIQNWVIDRGGLPAMARVRNSFGESHAKLRLSFERKAASPDEMNIDDGMMPVSWSAWLAELDRQHLALKVGQEDVNFEFVSRKSLN